MLSGDSVRMVGCFMVRGWWEDCELARGFFVRRIAGGLCMMLGFLEFLSARVLRGACIARRLLSVFANTFGKEKGLHI